MHRTPEQKSYTVYGPAGFRWKRTYERRASGASQGQESEAPVLRYAAPHLQNEALTSQSPPLQYEAPPGRYAHTQTPKLPMLSPKALAAEALTAGAACAGAIALRMQHKRKAEEERLAQQASLSHSLRGTAPQTGALLAAGAGLAGALAFKGRHQLAHYLHLGKDAHPSAVEQPAWQASPQEAGRERAGQGLLNDLRRAFSSDRPVWEMSQQEKESARENEGLLHDIGHVFFPHV